jgi:hypothetical protein
MMKKLAALAAALTFVSALPVPAAQAATKQPVPFKSGTITVWDAAAKHGAVKDPKGVETSFVWNEKTTLAGSAKVGEHAFVWYKTEKDGKLTATHITIGTKLAMQHAVRPRDAAQTPPQTQAAPK